MRHLAIGDARALPGAAEVEGAYVSQADFTLVPAWSSDDQAAWDLAAYNTPGNGISDGTITALSSTQCTVKSNSATQTWTANYWNGIFGQITCINPASSSIAFTEWRTVTACTALTAGGTAVITFDRPLENSGYTKYHLFGKPPGVSQVWRLYRIVPNYVAQHLVDRFPYGFVWQQSDMSVQTIWFPCAVIGWGPPAATNLLNVVIGAPAGMQVLPATGQVLFNTPTVCWFGTPAKLQIGGAAVDGVPTDIRVVVPYSRGVLTAPAPPDSGGSPTYAGTAYTRDGIERTVVRDYPDWRWAGDTSSYATLAANVLETVQDVVFEGALDLAWQIFGGAHARHGRGHRAGRRLDRLGRPPGGGPDRPAGMAATGGRALDDPPAILDAAAAVPGRPALRAPAV